MDLFTTVARLASLKRRTLGSMCVELIEYALRSEDYKDETEDLIKGEFRDKATTSALDGVDLNREKLVKLIKLLDAID